MSVPGFADRLFGCLDGCLARRDDVAERRTLEAIAFEWEPSDGRQEEEADGDVERPVVRRLDAEDEIRIIDTIDRTPNSMKMPRPMFHGPILSHFGVPQASM